MLARSARFLLAWSLLNALVNVLYPGNETKFSYLFPSLDVCVLLGVYAAYAAWGRRVPRALGGAGLAFLVLARLVRLGDGVGHRYLRRSLNLSIDLRLVPDAVRLLWTLLGGARIVLLGLLSSLALVGLLRLARRALSEAETYFQVARQRALFGAIVGALIVAAPFGPKAYGDEHFRGMFVPSLLPRLQRELDFALHISGYRQARLSELRAAAQRLSQVRDSLDRLDHIPVLLFIVEAYGTTVFDPKLETPFLREALQRFESKLAEGGYFIASSVLESPVYGGSSWLAQATLATGVQTRDEFEFGLLKALEPPAIADFFRRAGYRTLLVQPGTSAARIEPDFLHFDARYLGNDFGYRGPAFAWAPMPDQFVIDLIHRREVLAARAPLFVEYALVSSHAAWAELPSVVADWQRLGDGAIFATLEKKRFFTDLLAGPRLRPAYEHAIVYDFEVLERYLDQRLQQAALVFVVGDHQPIPDATGYAASRGVPLHVISRRRDLIEAWLGRGYAPTLRPRLETAPLPLSTFLPTLLDVCSTARMPGLQTTR